MKDSARAFLEDVAKRVPAEQVEITVRELLGHWGHTPPRNYTIIDEIERDLAEYGLTTVPDLADAGLRVRIVAAVTEQAPPQDGPAVEDEEAPVRVSLSVGDLRSARAGVQCVGLDDTLDHAETLMLCDDYSQLAVVQDGRLHGAVTWKSVRFAMGRGEQKVRAAHDPRPTTARLDEDLLAVTRRMEPSGFALVKDDADALVGIITRADLADQFVDVAHPFVLINEIEQRMRHLVDRICTLEEIRAKARYPNKTNGVHDLMFGDYKKIFEDPDLFSRCGWAGIARSAFVDKLDRVRVIRNEATHFRPEGIRDEQTQALKSFIEFLKGMDRIG
ncbi:CBS domain-containing protein [Thermomonospora cellulosilytica]|uniref:CBS domain-containing protein n=1 Tax=Thermomonospora cellulosilytica TaxID=1411118 RepID=A0A7W3R9Q9_9ACTN|nr:CBS domain-containing protein [Thermomonospora cellulosilytica]MBA9005012.1 CBS domain-containing protein [Thermomonospora cellulosilytica]